MFTRPDNSVSPSTVQSSDIDNAELAARLGINRLRRSGRVIFYDDFTDRAAWSLLGLATNGVYSAKQGQRPFTPPGLMYLNGGTASWGNANVQLPEVAYSVVGFEITFTLENTGAPNYVDQLIFQISAGNLLFQVKWDILSSRWYYLNASNIFVMLGGINLSPPDDGQWYNFKLVVDTINQNYKILYLNRGYVLMPYACYTGSTGTPVCSLQCYDANATPRGVMVDQVIVTTDEA